MVFNINFDYLALIISQENGFFLFFCRFIIFNVQKLDASIQARVKVERTILSPALTVILANSPLPHALLSSGTLRHWSR